MTDLAPRESAWLRLRRHTLARIGVDRTGVVPVTRERLAFRLDHAQARDAVHAALDAEALVAILLTRGLDPVILRSKATDRATYLVRPDLGRQLTPESAAMLEARSTTCELALVVADGLSARAVERHVPPLLDALLPRLADWHIGPLAVILQGRVAIGDEVGAALSADLAVVLIGERPGLSSPDSLGAYLTWEPRPGRVDAERNCISNIRPEGLGYNEAAARLAYLFNQARRRRLTGIALKDETGASPRLPP